MGWFEDNSAVSDIAQRSGLALEESDVRALASKAPEDREQFLRDLTAQSARRLTNTPGDAVEQPQRIAPLAFASPQAVQSSRSAMTQAAPQMSMADINQQIGAAPQSLQPFTEQFTYADFAPPAQRAPGYESFAPTTTADMEADPSWKLRMSEAQKALERSAAASGSYLTPNTMQAITRNSQDYASNEFGNVDSRRFRNWGAGYERLANEDATAFGNAATTYGTNRGNQQGLFDTRRSIFETNESNRFGSQTANRAADFNILTGNRNYGLAGQNMDLANRQFDYSRVTGDRNFGLANEGMDLSRQQFAFSKDQDAFNRNRTGYLDEYNMWNERDNEEQRRREFLVNAGRPT